MEANQIIEIINAIPEYIRYIYPGYIILYLYTFLRGFTLKDTKGIIIKALGISYLINILSEEFFNLHVYNALSFNLFLIISSIFISYILFIISKSDILQWILKFFEINTNVNEDEISILIDEKFTFIRVYLKNEPIIYEGYLCHYEIESDKENRFLALNSYNELYIDISSGYKECPIDNKNFYKKGKEKVLIYFKDINRIEKCSYKRIDEK